MIKRDVKGLRHIPLVRVVESGNDLRGLLDSLIEFSFTRILESPYCYWKRCVSVVRTFGLVVLGMIQLCD